MKPRPQMFLPTPTELILWDVIKEHLDEAVFQYRQWRRALRSPQYVLNQMHKGLESSLVEHLIGLSVAGPVAAERLLFPELEEMTSPSRTALASLVLLRSSERDMWYELLDFLIASEDEEQRYAMIEAIRSVEDPHFEVVLREAFERSRSPSEKAILLEVFAAIHLDPGDELGSYFDTGYTPLDRAVVMAAGNARRLDLEHLVEQSLMADDLLLRDAAIEAGLLLGSKDAWLRCRQRAAGVEGDISKAMLFVAQLGTPSDHDIIRGHLGHSATRKPALLALGYTGRIENIRYCLEYVESADVREAKIAAESIAVITGLRYHSFMGRNDHPEPVCEELDDESGVEIEEEEDTLILFEKDDLEADLVPDGIDELPHLDPFFVAQWWESNSDRFSRKRRYIAGEIFSSKVLVKALRQETMQRRPQLALELALRTGGRRWVTTDAFVGRQLRELDALSGLTERDLNVNIDDRSSLS